MTLPRLPGFSAITSVLAITATALAGGTPSAAEPAQTAGGTAIVLDPGDVLRPISNDLFGYAHRYNVNGMYGYDPVAGEVEPALVEAVRDSGTTVLRYPGAHPADGFDWKEAIGPPAERGCQPAPGWAGWADDGAYGVDEHARFAEQVGATTSLVVNFATGSAADAADWVEYMNTPVGQNPNGGTAWAQVRADNGHPEPYGVTWWEIGSEIGNANSWLGALPGADRSAAYAFGGTSRYTGQRMGAGCDHSPAAAVSSGAPNQTFEAHQPPIVAGSQEVYVGGVAWLPVTDLGAAGPDDPVYTVDPAAGTVSFGDGVHGAIPPSGDVVTADYTSGPHPGYVDFYRAMKAVDPDVEACWDGFGGVLDFTALGDEPLDCATDHPYTGGRPSTELDATQTHDWLMERGDQRGQQMVNLQQRLRDFDPDAGLGITEYGIFLGASDAGPTPGYLRSMEQGLLMGSMLTSWIDAGIPLANKYPLLNWDPENPPPGAPTVQPSMNQSDFGFFPTFVPQAGAHVTNLFTHMIGTDQVAGQVVNNPARTNSDTGSRYDALRIVASTDEQGRLTLIVVNRDPERDVTASVLPQRFRYLGDAEVWVVSGESFTAHNTPADPAAVSLVKDTVQVSQGGFGHTFPAHSVTAIRLTPSGPATIDPVSIDTGDSVTIERGEQVTTTVEITNTASVAAAGPRRAAGELTVTGPAGWSVDVSPDAYALQPGQSMQATVTVGVPEDTDVTEGGVVVGARQYGEVADIGVLDVTVTGLPDTDWEPLFTDTFDGDAVGQPPPAWTVTGPADGITVQPAETGNVLVAERPVAGTTPITGIRSFGATADDVRLSYRISADQTDEGMAVQLLDAEGQAVLRFNLGANGLFRYSNGSTVATTAVPYSAGAWYDVDLVFHAATGRYDAYVDGVPVAEAGRWPGSGPPAAVGVLIGAGNSRVASYALDDISVLTPQEASA